jgi:hypothetical protein
VVVRLDLERDRKPVAQVDDARVLTGALEDSLAGGGKAAEERRRVLVAAVLGPEEREDGQLEVVGRSVEQRADVAELAVGEAEAPVEWFRDRAQASSVSAPSDDPISRQVPRDR